MSVLTAMAYVLITVSIHQEVIIVIVLLDTAFNLTNVIVEVSYSILKLHHAIRVLLHESEGEPKTNSDITQVAIAIDM